MTTILNSIWEAAELPLTFFGIAVFALAIWLIFFNPKRY